MKSIFISKIQRNIEDYGMQMLVRKILTSLLGFFFLQRSYRLYFFDLTQPEKDEQNNSRLVFRKINPAEKELIQQIEEMSEWLRGQLKGKLLKGDICIGALDGSTIAGYNLITFGKVYIPLLKYTKIFKSRAAWSEQISVGKNYRRQGIAGLLRMNAFAILRQKGYTRLFGGALSSNHASLKLAEKLGFIMLADITLIKILCFKSWKIKKAWS
jgi:GNAT superfamily N-acetyltransferase